MVDTDRRPTATSWRALLLRVREALTPEAYERAPDYGPDAPDSDREAWLRQLGRVRDLLEETRAVVAAGGWCGGGAWFTVREPNGTVRAASLAESFALRSPRAQVAGGCLVGIMIRLADDPDRVPTTADVWRATDELREAMHERLGHDSYPPGRAYPMTQRRARLRSLTAWNDAPERTQADVLDLVDRAISRTIVGAVRERSAS
ncbi:hypothetical protein GCM10022204_25580 [Microlunatus aurantiacus]|uniref:Uncharacterized protein n=1 Tax=Microlunatus aurantiacus TaxID=446786 RepID=A0ABP7DMW2_9ACTN